MKKSAFPAALMLIGVALSGCPVYDDDAGCYDDLDCEAGYLCDGHTGTCYTSSDQSDDDDDDDDKACRKPSDCGANETCSRFGTCSSGDCHYSTVGCVTGYVCNLNEGRYRCVSKDDSGAGGAGADSGTGGAAGQAGDGG